jgi:hypothetical protein
MIYTLCYHAAPMLRPTLVLLLAAGCASTTQPIPSTWLSVPEAPRIRSLQLDATGNVTTTGMVPRNTAPIRVEGNRLFNGDRAITEAFAAIDSFDHHPGRGEIAFSAKREAGFDIGLVAADGSALNWIPADPADETDVVWAPRGNKISYFVRARGGDVVRTLHVPTSFQYAIDFPLATIHSLAWDPPAERYAVSYSTLDASDRVEVLRYDGTDRKTVIPPAARIAGDVLPFGANAYAIRPYDVQYGEKLPVVLWLTERLDWSDARAELMKRARVGMIVATKAGEDLQRLVRDAAWLDSSRVYVVCGVCEGQHPTMASGAKGKSHLVIVPDPFLPPGRYRLAGETVTVSPAAIQSFAAGFIADQLKRTGPTNGSSR